MQHQIADAVGLGIGSPPDLVISQPLQTLFDLGEIIPSQERPGGCDKGLARVSHFCQISNPDNVTNLLMALQGALFRVGLMPDRAGGSPLLNANRPIQEFAERSSLFVRDLR